jgi:hypothetical protein
MSGYRPCACPDCFEIAIGDDGAMCHQCDDAGCSGDRECQAAGAYGGEAEECEDNACTGCSWCDAQPEAQPQPEPLLTIERLLADAPAARAAVEALVALIPEAALADGTHAYWDTPAAAELMAGVITAIDAEAAKP